MGSQRHEAEGRRLHAIFLHQNNEVHPVQAVSSASIQHLLSGIPVHARASILTLISSIYAILSYLYLNFISCAFFCLCLKNTFGHSLHLHYVYEKGWVVQLMHRYDVFIGTNFVIHIPSLL